MPSPANSPHLEVVNGGVPFHCLPTPAVLGESPIYRASDHTLHWLDIFAKPHSILHILPIDPVTSDPAGPARSLQLSHTVTALYFRANHPGSYIVGYSNGIGFLDERTGGLDIIEELIPKGDRGALRMNDAGVDPQGRFWIGSADQGALTRAQKFEGEGMGGWKAALGEDYFGRGKLWCFEAGSEKGEYNVREVETGLLCSNGMAWSADGRTMYHNDSIKQITYAYDFEVETGGVSNRRIHINREGTPAENDGMVIDTKDNLWICLWNDFCLMQFDAKGVAIRRVMFPSQRMTCPTWGGMEFGTLFMTSASWGLRDKVGDEGGQLFKYVPGDGIRGNAKGVFAGRLQSCL